MRTEWCRRHSVLFFLLLLAAPACGVPSIEYRTSGALQQIFIDLKNPRVRVDVALARGFPHGFEPAEQILRRSRARAAITGTYFTLSSGYPISDIVSRGRLRYRGERGAALGITPTNQVTFQRLVLGRPVDWSSYETVLAAGPMLVRCGRVDLQPHLEGFSDPGLFGSARRTAVAQHRDGRLAFIATDAAFTMREFAQALLKSGYVEAINLDGGTSSYLAYNGRTLVEPGRELVNLLVVRDDVPPTARTNGRSGRSVESAEMARKSWQQGSIQSLYRAVDLDEATAQYRKSLADLLESSGHVSEAARHYVELALMLAEQGVQQEALRHAVHATRIAPRSIRAWRVRSELEGPSGSQSARHAFLRASTPCLAAAHELDGNPKRLSGWRPAPPKGWKVQAGGRYFGPGCVRMEVRAVASPAPLLQVRIGGGFFPTAPKRRGTWFNRPAEYRTYRTLVDGQPLNLLRIVTPMVTADIVADDVTPIPSELRPR